MLARSMSLSLYIHIPWCIRKCPYCDFNSHKSPDELPEKQYIDALLLDMKQDLQRYSAERKIESIFFGGGTPSLFSAKAFETLFQELQKQLTFASDIEITLEANPGTVESQRFSDYRALGINRLSLGIQSFHKTHLKALGRIHDDKEAHRAIETARLANFDNINIDLMYGLPGQTVKEGLHDLKSAMSYQPEHLSWYQLTIEPNTLFYKKKPTLPTDDVTYLLEEEGLSLLDLHGLTRYEISAFSKEHKKARHNLNYWLFGDYFGIGAGAHGKLTHLQNMKIIRTRKHRQPHDYLDKNKPFLASIEEVCDADLVFEFMLNTTRLEQPISNSLFTLRTGLEFGFLLPKLQQAEAKGFIKTTKTDWQITSFGRRYTNDLQALFLP